MDITKLHLEVVMPIYNERGNLPELVGALDNALLLSRDQFRISYLFVDDGSKDGSLEYLKSLHMKRSDIRIVKLIHNFGHGAALTCGVTQSRGDLVVFMDADMQDDPLAIRQMITSWKQGACTVVAERASRKEKFRFLFQAFYFLLHKLSKTIPPISFGTFCLLERSVVDRMKTMNERIRYFPGLVSLCSNRIESILVPRQERFDGKSRVGFVGLFHLAITALLSFSSLPIRLISVFGMLASSIAFVLGIYILYERLFTQNAILGWASTMTSIFFGTGIELLCLGLIGEYVARIYDEVKARPMFLVETTFELGQAGLEESKRAPLVA